MGLPLFFVTVLWGFYKIIPEGINNMFLDRSASQLACEFDRTSQLYHAQPVRSQHFLDQQAATIVSALEKGRAAIRYQLPERAILDGGESLVLPPAIRRRVVHFSMRDSTGPCPGLVRHLTEMERGLNPALSACAKILRFALANSIVHSLLPDGRPVRYQPENGDEIPSIPVDAAPPATWLAEKDAAAELNSFRGNGGGLQVPYVAEARRFYLPQWVAFGEADRLLVGSLAEAKASIASLEKSVHLLQSAVSICPSVVVDETYQRKRAGLLGQLVNQGRALARFYTQEIILKIHSRAADGTLNRGLSLSLPYFDDGALSLRIYPVEIIPNGRAMFAPSFVVLAMRKTEEQILGDYRLNPSTRKHLLRQLISIEDAFQK
jgi:hypothetical protein